MVPQYVQQQSIALVFATFFLASPATTLAKGGRANYPDETGQLRSLLASLNFPVRYTLRLDRTPALYFSQLSPTERETILRLQRDGADGMAHDAFESLNACARRYAVTADTHNVFEITTSILAARQTVVDTRTGPLFDYRVSPSHWLLYHYATRTVSLYSYSDRLRLFDLPYLLQPLPVTQAEVVALDDFVITRHSDSALSISAQGDTTTYTRIELDPSRRNIVAGSRHYKHSSMATRVVLLRYPDSRSHTATLPEQIIQVVPTPDLSTVQIMTAFLSDVDPHLADDGTQLHLSELRAAFDGRYAARSAPESRGEPVLRLRPAELLNALSLYPDPGLNIHFEHARSSPVRKRLPARSEFQRKPAAQTSPVGRRELLGAGVVFLLLACVRILTTRPGGHRATCDN